MKTAFITGRGRGLGLGFASYLLNEGHRVFIGVRDPAKVSDDIRKNANIFIVKLDVTKDESVSSAYREVFKQTDHIDYLINNAGLNKDSATNGNKQFVCDFKDLDREKLLKMFDVDAIAPMMVA